MSGDRRDSWAKVVSTVTFLPPLAILYYLSSREYLFLTGMMLCLKTPPHPNLGYFLHTQALATMQLSAQGTENPTTQLPTDSISRPASCHWTTPTLSLTQVRVHTPLDQASFLPWNQVPGLSFLRVWLPPSPPVLMAEVAACLVHRPT